ncbi:MAG: type II secretion system protein [Planctomycetota bacterium]
MKKKGYTLIELLAVIFIIAATMSAWKSVSSSYGLWWGIGAGILAGALSILLVILFYYWMGRIEERILTKLRNKYTAIYRVKTVPSDPKIIILPEGAEIRVGDIGWEAGPNRDDGLIYLQGLTSEWTVVWHAGFHPDEIEKVAKKPSSQYDVECPYGADLSSLPACPFTVVERKTMTAGLPRNAIYVYENPAEYHPVTRSTDP